MDAPAILAAAAMPEAIPKASRAPKAMNWSLGKANISLVTIPAWKRMNRMVEYAITYPNVLTWAKKKGYLFNGTKAILYKTLFATDNPIAAKAVVATRRSLLLISLPNTTSKWSPPSDWFADDDADDDTSDDEEALTTTRSSSSCFLLLLLVPCFWGSPNCDLKTLDA